MKQAFPPVINDTSRILILGTMPGEESLRRQEYYANPRNQFWRIIGEIYQVRPGVLYSERVAFLLQRGLALWDVLESCERVGSLDRDIKNPVPNNFQTLFETHGNIRALAFNGQKAHNWFEKWVIQRQAPVGLEQLQTIILPSTSPAATIALAEKVRRWRIIAEL